MLKASEGGTRQGEEVLITYGDLDNDQLLQRFGFVEAECPHDTFVVSKEFVAEALEVRVVVRQPTGRPRPTQATTGDVFAIITKMCGNFAKSG